MRPAHRQYFLLKGARAAWLMLRTARNIGGGIMALIDTVDRLDRLYDNVWLDTRHRDLFLTQIEMIWPDLSQALRAYAVKSPPG
jgi:hypothetical protein